MKEELFQKQRVQEWKAFETQIDILTRRPPKAFAAATLYHFGLMYRRMTTDLSLAQSRGYSEGLRYRLNRLVAQGHVLLYGASRADPWRRLRTFYGRSFPNELRCSWRPLAFSTSLLAGATLCSYLLVAQNQENGLLFLSVEDFASIHRSLHNSNFLIGPEMRPAVAAQIITNNLHVAAFAFAGGITLGLVTAYLIFFNGGMLGTLAFMYGQAGFGVDFWATIAPHGVLELSAITISGTAGFVMAGGVLFPGRLRRTDALVEASRRAGVLIAGVFSMLLIAGCIEGFFTPLRTSIPVRLGMGLITGILMLLYFLFAGRKNYVLP